jgi:hypothetical protein
MSLLKHLAAWQFGTTDMQLPAWQLQALAPHQQRQSQPAPAEACQHAQQDNFLNGY